MTISRIFRLKTMFVAVRLCLIAGLSFNASPLAAADDDGAEKLPIKKVVLFNSGVGFFEHRGNVEGNDKVDLRFKVSDVNDLLKSMVLQDLGGGRISTVSYGSRDPITKTLRTFSIDLTGNPTMANLLDQVRGEKVQISAPNEIVGTILGVERRKQRVGKDEVIAVDYLNLLTEQGLRSVSLENVGLIKLTNPSLDAELREALKVLAMSHATDKKTVTLNFLGKGQRPVRVGYIQESPVWKTSYRLVLDEDQPPFMQGWAIVENTTDADWKDVALTLVSGRPISFVMDLYSPLYATRPVVQHELYASLRPPSYDQDLATNQREFGKLADRRKMLRDGEEKERAASISNSALARRRSPNSKRAYLAKDEADQSFDLKSGVRSVAQTANVGELFRYTIATPVSLGRQRSAMLPIVNDSVKGEKVSIYNPSVHAKHPLNGLRLTNSSGLHLMQGPITVFDEGVYAGDAKIPDMPPGTERLISYAMDLDTEVAPTSKNRPEQLINVRLIKGILYTSRKYVRTQSYVVKNSGRRDKNVLIEYPVDSSWKLIEPAKPAETTRGLYRFAVVAKPGEAAKLNIEEERVVSQQVAVTNIPDSTIRIYLSQKVVSDKVKAALSEVIRRKQALALLVAQRNRLTQEIQIISQEQNRIRQNMAQLPKSSDLFNRYIKKFTDQENKIEDLREAITKLKDDEAKARRALDDFLIDLNLS